MADLLVVIGFATFIVGIGKACGAGVALIVCGAGLFVAGGRLQLRGRRPAGAKENG